MLYDPPTLKANSVDWIRDARDAKVFTQEKKQKTRPLQILGVAEKTEPGEKSPCHSPPLVASNIGLRQDARLCFKVKRR